MSYKKEIVVISVPISRESNEKLKEISKISGHKSKTDLARTMFEETISNTWNYIDKENNNDF